MRIALSADELALESQCGAVGGPVFCFDQVDADVVDVAEVCAGNYAERRHVRRTFLRLEHIVPPLIGVVVERHIRAVIDRHVGDRAPVDARQQTDRVDAVDAHSVCVIASRHLDLALDTLFGGIDMRRCRRVFDKIVARSEINLDRKIVAVAVQYAVEIFCTETRLLRDRILDVSRQHADLVFAALLVARIEERFERFGAVDELDCRVPGDLARPPFEDLFCCGQVRCFADAGVPDRSVGGRHRRARLARRDCRR